MRILLAGVVFICIVVGRNQSLANDCQAIIADANDANYQTMQLVEQIMSDHRLVANGSLSRESVTAKCSMLSRMHADSQRAMNYANKTANIVSRATSVCNEAIAREAVKVETSMINLSDSLRDSMARMSQDGRSLGCSSF
ncbi:MAG: hypothetical protein AAF607_15455 [Pseudomonadota bacterium]